MTDFITVLRARSGARLTKAWRATPEGLGIAGYEDAKTFDAVRCDVDSLDRVYDVLQSLREQSSSCVIRGAYPALLEAGSGASVQRVLRRVEETVDTPHRWMMVDVDDYVPLADPVDDPAAACCEFIEEHLPPEFQQREFIWQLSASAGAPGKLHLLKAHLWFWLSEPVDSVALRQWAKGWGRVDAAVYRQVQPHYVADPLFEGVDDPVPTRMGMAVSGTRDEGPVPVSFLGSIRAVQATGDTDAEDADLSKLKGAVAGYDIDRVRSELLEQLDPNMEHDDWVQVGMALHHQFDGADEALALWDEWSSEGASWTEDVCAERWKSFAVDRTAGTGSVTLRWLLKLIKDKREKQAAIEDRRRTAREIGEKKAERPEMDGKLTELLARIAAAAQPAVLELEIAPDARAAAGKMIDSDRAAIVEAMAARLKDLKAPVHKATIKKWITPAAAAPVAAGPASWVADWCYVTNTKLMYNIKTREALDREAFNQAFTHLVPLVGAQVAPTPAYQYVMQFDKQVVDALVYAPPYDAVFEFRGRMLANSYRPERVPAEPETFGPEDLEYIAVVEEWLHVLAPDARERGILISWLAHNVRRPGIKIGWSPYVHSNVHGAGKTSIANFLEAMMGYGSVATYPGSVLCSKFSGWESESAVALLDEFPAQRWGEYDGIDPVEKLKNIITSAVASIERKGRDIVIAPSFCNVILVANTLSGLKVADTDRRLFFVSSPLTREQHVERERTGFYGRLHNAFRHGGGALRRWILAQPVHEEFGVNVRAPHTLAKEQAIELSKSDLHSSIEDLLDEGGPGYSRTVVSTPHLRRALTAQDGGHQMALKRRGIEFVLQEIGFSRVGKVRLGKEVCNAWIGPGAVAGRRADVRAAVAAELKETLDAARERALDESFLD